MCVLKLRWLGEQFFFFLAQVFEGGNTVPSFSHAEGVVLEEEVPG